MLVVAALCCTTPAIADEDSAKATLEAKGLQVKSSSLSVEKETELRGALKDVTKVRKELFKSTKDLAKVQKGCDTIRAKQNYLQKQYATLSARLAADASNGKLIATLNAINAQQQLLETDQEKAEKLLGEARDAWLEQREKYLQLVLDMRTMVDDIEAAFEKHVKDDEVKKALDEYNDATGKKLALEPSRGFASAVRRLETIEKDVLSESIKLRRERNTLYASVMVNGKYAQEMVVDSGASLISLPAKVAEKLGVTPTEEDPVIILVMADGREIQGRKVMLDEVRVGQFVVKNVEAAVLGPDATNAEPLLGMSFLGNFKFELDAKAGTLDMINIEGANPAEATGKTSSSRRRRND